MRLAGYVDWRSIPATAAEHAWYALLSLEARVDAEAAFLGVFPGPDQVLDAQRGLATVGEVVVACDARLDNTAELRGMTPGGRHVSTVALIAAAYEKWGDGFADRLRGDFAIIIWDASRKRLVAATDPFSVRPLFYRTERRRLWLSTGIDRLVSTFPRAPALDDETVVEHLTSRFVLSGRTFFRDIRSVLPGHILIADQTSVCVKRYWHPPLVTDDRWRDPREHGQQFRDAFLLAVERRLRSPGPVTIHVSGGVDSSSIAAAADLLHRHGRVQAPLLLGASPSYPGLACDEQEYIDAVARSVGFSILSWNGLNATALDLEYPGLAGPGTRVANIDGTFGDVDIARSHGSQVILSGFGGDQLGTPSGMIIDRLRQLSPLAQVACLLFGDDIPLSRRASRIRFVLREAQPRQMRKLVALARADVPGWLTSGYRPMARAIAATLDSGVRFQSAVSRFVWSNLNGAAVIRSLWGLRLQGADHGVEYRFPFLDRDLVELVLRTPYRFWPVPGPYERLHRQTLASILPAAIQGRRSKAEFTEILARRIRLAQQQISDLLSSSSWHSGVYVDQQRVAAEWRSDPAQSAGWSSLRCRRTWAVATLEAWLRRISRL